MVQDLIEERYQSWLEKAVLDSDIVNELHGMRGDIASIEDAFYKTLTFGTGGLRGLIGAGCNRMNVYTVAKASQGLAAYVKKTSNEENRRIALSYDSRIKSELFARVAAGVFAANGIEVLIYSELMPTPCLSFATRQMKCAAGVMVTASHNPWQYNGYKVYGADGSQVTTEVSNEILIEIEQFDIFKDIQSMDFEKGIEKGWIQYIPEHVVTAFIEAVKSQSVIDAETAIDKNIAIVYSPLNGTGLKPVLRILRETGYSNVTVVKEQEQPNGYFSTCLYPNPETEEAMALGIEYAKKNQTELFLATDPDCDRVGIAVRNTAGEYVRLSGNETGILLLDYICSRRKTMKTMPENPVMIKSIVTMDMAEMIAAHYDVRTINVLTGFKFIGEQMTMLEKNGSEKSFILGFEESCGYLSGSYVRDKDALDGVFLICEMTAYYKARGISLLGKLEELYETFGFYLNTLHSYEFEGAAGSETIKKIMKTFRSGIALFGPKEVQRCNDYATGLDGLPKAEILKFLLADNCSVVVRPSGTEPKLKVYISVCEKSMNKAVMLEKEILKSLNEYIR